MATVQSVEFTAAPVSAMSTPGSVTINSFEQVKKMQEDIRSKMLSRKMMKLTKKIEQNGKSSARLSKWLTNLRTDIVKLEAKVGSHVDLSLDTSKSLTAQKVMLAKIKKALKLRELQAKASDYEMKIAEKTSEVIQLEAQLNTTKANDEDMSESSSEADDAETSDSE